MQAKCYLSSESEMWQYGESGLMTDLRNATSKVGHG